MWVYKSFCRGQAPSTHANVLFGLSFFLVGIGPSFLSPPLTSINMKPLRSSFVTLIPTLSTFSLLFFSLYINHYQYYYYILPHLHALSFSFFLPLPRLRLEVISLSLSSSSSLPKKYDIIIFICPHLQSKPLHYPFVFQLICHIFIWTFSFTFIFLFSIILLRFKIIN